MRLVWTSSGRKHRVSRQQVRHVIDHGNAGYAHYSCTHSSLPKNVTEWSCSTVRNGEKYGVQFGVQPF